MPEQNKFATHVVYNIEIDHSHSTGLVACPVAGTDPQPASILRLHAPFELLAVNWTATRNGAPPVVPSHKSFLRNVNRMFLSGSRGGSEKPTIGAHIWSCAGVYLYSVAVPEGLDSDFPLAKVPWDNGQIGEFYIPAKYFDTQHILNPMQPRRSNN